MCDTKEMCDALNRRIHDQTVDAEAPTVAVARGQRIAVGDLIISRRNDPALAVFDADDIDKQADPVRNGQRWRVYAVDPDHQRIAARRLEDGARAAFTGDYLRQHITHGYAVTVHSAQGVTADTTHAVLGEKCSRALLYVALTRGRESNQAYLYERIAGEGEHEHAQPDGLHVMRRGSGRDAGQLVRGIIANHDQQARTAHHIAGEASDREQLPDHVQSLLDRRAKAVATRRNHYRAWCRQVSDGVIDRQLSRDQQLSRSRNQSRDYGLDL